MSLRRAKTSAPIWLDGIPPLMRERELKPLDRPIIERVAIDTPEKRYVNTMEAAKFGPDSGAR